MAARSAGLAGAAATRPLIAAFTNFLIYLIGGRAVLNNIVPKTTLELGVWLVLSASAGFCEETIFRGYPMQQFSFWTGSRFLGLVSQGVVSGLVHGYYGRGVVVIAVHGCLLGTLARWRRSLRPGMLAHGLQDGLGGLAGFLSC